MDALGQLWTGRRIAGIWKGCSGMRRNRSLTRRLQVEPQEKKKKPKGRAYKRMVYTRRFVNVTMTGGKRKVWQTHLEEHRNP